jgi:hypothetical protein
MPIKKNPNGTYDLGPYDPLVDQLLSESSNRTKQRRTPVKQWRAIEREKRKAEARAERRVGFDLDPEVISEVKHIAEENSATNSSLVNLILRLWLKAYHQGECDLSQYRQPAKPNPRYDNVFALPEK